MQLRFEHCKNGDNTRQFMRNAIRRQEDSKDSYQGFDEPKVYLVVKLGTSSSLEGRVSQE